MHDAPTLVDRQTALSDIPRLTKTVISGLPSAPVTIRHIPHTAKISLRGHSDDADFMAAAGRVLDMVLPTNPLTSVSTTGADGPVEVLNLGPDEWLITGAAGMEGRLSTRLADAVGAVRAAVVDVTENSTVLRISGDKCRQTLAKGLPLDTDDSRFPVGAVAQSIVAKADVLIHRRADVRGSASFDLYVRRSFADYLWAWLIDAGGEYGISYFDTGSGTEPGHDVSS